MGYVSKEYLKENGYILFRYQKSEDGSEGVLPVNIDDLPEVDGIIHCKDCKHHWVHKCMDSPAIERCDLNQTFYDADYDFCSLAERRTE